MIQAPLFELEQIPIEEDFTSILDRLGVSETAAWPDAFGRAIRSHFKQNLYAPIRTLSLFAGGGGLDIAFHDAGFKILEMVEIEAKYAATLAQNAQAGGLLAGSRVMCQDIQTYFPPEGLEVDFIIGGPPCQTFSAAGRRAAGVSGTDDPRGILFREYVRLLKQLKPKGFLFENVYGITGAQNGEAWEEIRSAFAEAGYAIAFRVLDTADYGVPQHRERLFIVGLQVGLQTGSYRFPQPTHGPDSPNQHLYFTAARAITGVDTRDATFGLGGRFGELLDDIPPGLNYSFYTKELGHPYPVFGWRSKFSDFLYKADPEMPVRTLKAQGGQYTGPFHWANRPFTVGELKRLQTFPDQYALVGGKQVAIQQLGNSVPPQMGRILALSILDQAFGVKLPFRLPYLEENIELGFRQRKRSLTQRYAQKAAEALKQLGKLGKLVPFETKEFSLGKSVGWLRDDFAWSEKPEGQKVFLEYQATPQTWLIHAALRETTETAYRIQIKPKPQHPWVLDCESVVLQAGDWSDASFTALWKALEQCLAETTGKADLVQLSGYYQYNPKIQAKLELSNSAQPNWWVLQKVLEYRGVNVQADLETLALLWECSKETVLNLLRWLRQLGFEVRSHNTNNQIPEGYFLVPYAFPTLNPKSVQLRKQLEVTG